MTAAQHQASEWQGFEQDEVFTWRHAQLVRSGFPEPDAGLVAQDGRYDLHELVELIDRGCPPELALRIVAPLEENQAAA